MLLGGIGILSALLAALCAWGRELWLLPVYFLGFYGALFVLALIFLWVLLRFVDPQEEPEHDSKFYRFFMYLYIDALITLVGAKVRASGAEKIPEGRFLLVCNHQHMADPGLLLSYLKKYDLTFISKQENRTMPVIGKFLVKIRGQFLDRDNDRQALKVILNCIKIIRDGELSVGVFPEGTRSRDGKVHTFRPGVFKIAQKAGVPIVVCTVKGSDAIFRNLRKLKTTPVRLNVVGVIPAEELAGVHTAQIADRVYEMMIADLGGEYRCEA